MTDRAPTPQDRLAGLLKALTFVGIAAAAVGAALLFARALGIGRIDIDHPTIGDTLAGNALLLGLTVVLPALVVRRAFGDDWATFGLEGPRRARRLLVGTCSGFGAIALLMATLAIVGAMRFGGSGLSWSTTLGDGVAYAVIFALTALSEEGLFRGYLLTQFRRAAGFWPAALVTSAIFAALHLTHGDETAAGVLSTALFGLVMAISVRRTGSLWFALGFHAAWDFGETFVFGVADSGMTGRGALLVPTNVGPDWMTGGAVGPEGSLFALPLLVAIAVLIARGDGRYRSPASG